MPAPGYARIHGASGRSGSAGLVASVACRDIDGLYDYISLRLGATDAIQHLEVAPMALRLKGAGSLFSVVRDDDTRVQN